MVDISPSVSGEGITRPGEEQEKKLLEHVAATHANEGVRDFARNWLMVHLHHPQTLKNAILKFDDYGNIGHRLNTYEEEPVGSGLYKHDLKNAHHAYEFFDILHKDDPSQFRDLVLPHLFRKMNDVMGNGLSGRHHFPNIYAHTDSKLRFILPDPQNRSIILTGEDV
jgi:hypothetical protein